MNYELATVAAKLSIRDSARFFMLDRIKFGTARKGSGSIVAG